MFSSVFTARKMECIVLKNFDTLRPELIAIKVFSEKYYEIVLKWRPTLTEAIITGEPMQCLLCAVAGD